MNEEVQVDSEVQQLSEERPAPCAFLTGRAGTGKSYEVMRRTQEDPDYACVTATTGIAAVNLGAVTINSTLRYFDTASMRDAYLCGALTRTLHKIAKEKKWFLVEEASMLDADQLDYLHRAVGEANRYSDVKEPMGIMLVGDFAQLPPINAEWAFKAACWGEFAANTTRLEKVWRQQEGSLFLEALNHAREGRGGACAEVLTQAGVKWYSSRVVEFDGTTILPKRDMVSRHNGEVLRGLPGKAFTLHSKRWGQQRSEWGENKRTHEWGIPLSFELKIGAYVTMLTNRRDFSVVNGDCGHVMDYSAEKQELQVKVVRTGDIVSVTRECWDVSTTDKPEDWASENEASDGGYHERRHYNPKEKKYVLGQVLRFPLQLGYASTCHKSQGLSLDKVQVDLRDRFFGGAAMAYVALSRCRTLEGLRLVIDKDSFVRRVQMDTRVRPWL
jgi:ATP-dependent exoDNAse (exonuclease V) alpha subunit